MSEQCTEQCSPHMPDARFEQCTEHMHGRTDGRNGLTKSLSHLPEITPSSVTRAPAYGFSPLADSIKAAMTTCPACGRPMSVLLPNKNITRRYCSRRCVLLTNHPYRHKGEVDEVAVMRLIDGDPVHSTKAERLEAVRALTDRGQSAAWIAQQLRITPRSVQRLRAELNTRREIAA